LGKVRPERVKRIARELLSRFPDRFTADFRANKELVKSLVKTSSPKLRNMIAGYVTHLVSTAQTTKVETEEETP
jgi:small subunit ribosomal protein S17e